MTSGSKVTNFADAISAMASPADRTFTPNPAAVAVYNKMYKLYRRLHDSFGTANHSDSLGDVMKESPWVVPTKNPRVIPGG